MIKVFITSLIFSIVINYTVFAQQQLSNQAQISVLTIGPGMQLYDAFGHSGLRIKDPVNNIDLVYNYGEYNFNTPNFYTKFAQGKLEYQIGVNYFETVYNIYRLENRSIKEQVLNLNADQKQILYNYLVANYKPENRFYLYDFFHDNCATKIHEVIAKAVTDSIYLNKPDNFKLKTFRASIHEKVPVNSWGRLGIDIALGSLVDKPMTLKNYLFLPENIYQLYHKATIGNTNKPLVASTSTIFKQTEVKRTTSFLKSPLFITSILALIVFAITFSDYRKKKRTKWLDIILFVITGIIGGLILLLWFGTNHKPTAYNYNLLWAFALNLFVVTQLLKSKPQSWFIKYLKFLLILLCLMILHWIIGVQVFAVVLIPFIIALFVRYLFLIIYFKNQ